MQPPLHKIFKRKWSIKILDLLEKNQELNYKNIEKTLSISSQTLTETTNCLIKYNLIKKTEEKHKNVKYKTTKQGSKFLQKTKELQNILNKK